MARKRALAAAAAAMSAEPLKFDTEKIRLELVPPELILGAGKVLTFGARKYSAGNWASGEGFQWSRLYGGLQRHLVAFWSGEDTDPESGYSHLEHAACMLAFLMAHRARAQGVDDRVAVGVRPRKTRRHATRQSIRSRPADTVGTAGRKAAPAARRRRAVQG